MNWDDIFVPSVTGAITAFIGWIVGKRKENLDNNASEIANTKEIIAMWKVTAQEMSDKVKELSDKVDTLTGEVQSLRAENADLKLKLGLDENQPNRTKRSKPDKNI
jgi:cell shape-determining protein MreC